MKKSFFILIIGIVFFNSTLSKSATLQQILSAYCVPNNENNCVGKNKASFTGSSLTGNVLTKNYCECKEDNMYYDRESRSCKNCVAYEFTPTRKETKCSPIYCKYTGDFPIKVGRCPDGYEKIAYKDYIK